MIKQEAQISKYIKEDNEITILVFDFNIEDSEILNIHHI